MAMTTATSPEVSVAICTRNRSAGAVRAAASILANDYPHFEFLLIDQSTNGETAEAVRQFRHDPRFHYIRTQTKGTGLSRDVALRLATGKYLLFTDDDCFVPKDWVERMAGLFGAHPAAFAVFCEVHAVPHDRRTGTVPTFTVPAEEIAVDSLAEAIRRNFGLGAGMGVSRELLLRIGGFDHALGPGSRFKSGEDFDIVIRGVLNRFRIYYTSTTAVVHDGFRTHAEYRQLTRRDWYALGALVGKHVRAQTEGARLLVGHFLFDGTIRVPFAPLIRLRRPRGLSRIVPAWLGFTRGLATPVDPRTLLFRPLAHLNPRNTDALSRRDYVGVNNARAG